jgi:hypothetical protein
LLDAGESRYRSLKDSTPKLLLANCSTWTFSHTRLDLKTSWTLFHSNKLVDGGKHP